MTGAALRERREAAGVRAVDLARVLGVSRSAITHLEGRDNVQPATSARFLEAVVVLAEQRRAKVAQATEGISAERRAHLARVGHAAIDQGLDLLVGSALGGH